MSRFDDLTLEELLANNEPKRLRLFASIEFPSETIYCHNGVGTRPFMGRDWSGVGEMASLSGLKEDGSMNANRLNLSIVHDDPELFRQALDENPVGGEVEVYLVLLDDNLQVLGGTLVFAGDITDYQLKKGTPYTISIAASDWFEVWDRPVQNAKITDASQQHLYPGDRIFDQVEKLAQGIDLDKVEIR